MLEIVEAWRSAWESLDPVRVTALYAPTGRHRSAVISRVCPELGRNEVRGHGELAEYVRRVAGQVEHLRFEAITVVADARRTVIEYRSHVPEKAPLQIVELLELDDDFIQFSRVYHGSH